MDMGLSSGLRTRPAWFANRLLDRLPRADRAKVLSSCDSVQLRPGETLAVPGEILDYVYFPTGGFISLLAPTDAKGFIEIALVGTEGLCGAPVVLGADRSNVRAEVRGEGTALRMKTAAFRRELARLPRFRAIADLYVHVLMSQLGRSAGCSAHIIEQRVACWLLAMSDRANSPHVHMTHEHLGRLLGVRRVGVTEALGALQARGVIHCERARVSIRDHEGLEAASCHCFEANSAIYRSSFPDEPAIGTGLRRTQGGANAARVHERKSRRPDKTLPGEGCSEARAVPDLG